MSQRHEWRSLRIMVACADALAIVLTYTLAFGILLRTLDAASLAQPSVAPALTLAIYAAGWCGLLLVCGLYEPEHLLDGVELYTRVVHAATAGILLFSFIAFICGMFIMWPWLIASWLLAIFAFSLSRFFIRRVAWYLRRRGQYQARMLIIGAGEDGLSIGKQISGYAKEAGQVVGYLDEYNPIGTPVAGSVVLGDPLALARVARQTNASDAIIVPQTISWESLQLLLQGGAEQWGVRRLWLAPSFRDLLTTGMQVHQCGSLPLLSVTGPRIIGVERMLKRSLDICLALLLLPVALLLGMIIAAWLVGVRHVAPFDRRELIGWQQRRCTLVTFAPVPELRRLHLWRLPALLNILRGDLTLVGPRPIESAFELAYRPWLARLTSVRPGLTGPWWFSKSYRGNSRTAEIGADLSYIRHYTIWFDLQIFAWLVRWLITGKSESWSGALTAPEEPEFDSAAYLVPVSRGENR